MKNKKSRPTSPRQPVAVPGKETGISRAGKKIILAGVGVLIAGYFILTKTDPAGQNWASTISPFLILGGYAIIGAGILFPGKSQPSAQ